MKKVVTIASFVLSSLLAVPAFADDDSAAIMKAEREKAQILMEKIKADKKFITAENMDFTDAEAKAFWPLYDDYQSALIKINEQTADLIIDYAHAYRTNTLTDAHAIELLNGALAVDTQELALKKDFVPKLLKVLPGIKAARYMQIENKLRAIVKMGLAEQVPLAK